MSSNHESTTAVFNAFIEASKALDELPRVKADLEAAQALAAETETKLNTWRNKSDTLVDQLNALRSELAAKEADLAQATKSNRDLSAVVDLIRGNLPPVPVAPSPVTGPSDMPAGTVSAANTEQGPAGAARLNSESQSAARLNPDQDQSVSDPTSGTTQTSTLSESNTSQHGTSSDRSGERDAPFGQGSGSSAGTGPQEQQNTPIHSTTTSTSGAGDGTQGQRDTDPMNQNPSTATANNNTTQPHPADSPNAGGTTGQQGQATGDREPSGEAVDSYQGTGAMSTHSTAGQSGISSSPEPRRPHWTKPNEQSWQSWINNGGEPAPWMR